MKKALVLTLVLAVLATSIVQAEAYSIRKGDEIQISIQEAEEFNGTYIVGEDGRFDFPEVGSIEAYGKSLSQVIKTIRSGLEGGYLTRATVRARITKYSPARYYIYGMVKTPGVYEIPPGSTITVLHAIAFAGGLREEADPSRIKLVRREGDAIHLDLQLAFEKGDTENDREIHEGDMLFVVKEEARMSFVFGAVRKPGRIDYPEGLETLSLGVVMALAGGLKEISDGEVQVLGPGAEASGTVKPFRAHISETGISNSDLKEEVKPGSSVFVLDNKTMVYVMGMVKKPGAFPYRKGLTLTEAIVLAGGFAPGSAENRAKVITPKPSGDKHIRRLDLAKMLDSDEGTGYDEIELIPGTIIVIPESRF
ncbi:MAG: SLBB domain-containing protein [Planctomycetota bacterium]|nr:SLBB domain-containing protein [Planctomycetota bacterium]